MLPIRGGSAGERGAGSPDKDAFSLDEEEKKMKVQLTKASGCNAVQWPAGTILEDVTFQDVVDLVVEAHSCSMGWGHNGFCDIAFVVFDDEGKVVATKA